MLSFRIIVLPVWIAFIVLLSGCREPLKTGMDILEIEGVSWACNVTTSYAVFGSSAESEEDLQIALPASDGDLLYMLYDDLQFYYRYSPENGNSFRVTFDTLQTVTVYLNGQLSYMELGSPASLEAFKMLTEAEMEQLSVLYISDMLSEDLLSIFKQHAGFLEGTGLVLENNKGSGRLQDLLSIVRPNLMVIDDSWPLPEPEEQISLSSLELLWVEGNIQAVEKLARCCSNLESLIIADWEPLQGELLPLSELNNLTSLTIAESYLTSLSSIEFPKILKNLYLISCDTLSDINGLFDLQRLSSLSLTQCTKIEDPGLLKELESLQRLSLPPGISHQDFREITQNMTGLEVVELIDCPDIQDLSPLELLPELKILQLQLDYGQLSRLENLNQLDLVVLTSEVFDDNPEWISELRTSLPTTKIVPGSGICLGSGWLLLLLPCILIFRYMFRRKI